MIRRSGTISEGFAKSLDKLAALSAIEQYIKDGVLEKDPNNPNLCWVVGTKFHIFSGPANGVRLILYEERPTSLGVDLFEVKGNGSPNDIPQPSLSDILTYVATAEDKAKKKQFQDWSIRSLVGEK